MTFKPGWKVFEDYARSLFGLDSTIGSGSKFYDQGDGVQRDNKHPFPIYLEAKSTVGKSYSLKHAEIVSWQNQAIEGSGRNLVMAIRIWPGGQGKPLDLAVMDIQDAKALIDNYEESNGV